MKILKLMPALVFIFSVFLTAAVKGQTKDDVVLKYNEGVEMANSDLSGAVAIFKEVHEMATTVGTDADDIKGLVESQISQLQYKYATELYKAKKIDESIENYLIAKDMGEKFGDTKTADKATDIVSKLYFSKGNSFYKKDDFENALTYFDNALNYNPDYAKVYLSKGLVYKKQDDTENMISAMKMAIEKGKITDDPKTVATASKVVRDNLLVQANGEIQAENFTGALELLQTSTEFGEPSTQALYLMAVAYNKNSEWDKALESAQKGLDIEEDNNEAKAKFYFEMGNAYAGKGDNTSACSAFKSAAFGNYTEPANYQLNTVLQCN